MKYILVFVYINLKNVAYLKNKKFSTQHKQKQSEWINKA